MVCPEAVRFGTGAFGVLWGRMAIGANFLRLELSRNSLIFLMVIPRTCNPKNVNGLTPRLQVLCK